MSAESDAPPADTARDRRETPDRRRRLLYSLFVGGLNPRRRTHRREGTHARGLDMHEAKWLGVAMIIMLMSVADAMLTLQLMNLGAVEVNPVMAFALDGGSPAFAYLKVALTSLGVVVLTVMARVHAFGRIPVGLVLYGVLGLYGSLVFYEFRLLEHLQPGP